MVILQNLAPAAIQFCADWFRNRPVGVQGGEAPAHTDDGCPMCRVHADLAESERLLQAMIEKADAGGAIPEHFRGTVRLVELSLRSDGSVQGNLARIAAERPELAEQVAELRRCVSRAHDDLPARSAIDVRTARTAHDAVHRCWQLSIDLCDAYYAAPTLSDQERVLRFMAALPEPERARFVASLGA